MKDDNRIGNYHVHNGQINWNWIDRRHYCYREYVIIVAAVSGIAIVLLSTEPTVGIVMCISTRSFLHEFSSQTDCGGIHSRYDEVACIHYDEWNPCLLFLYTASYPAINMQ